MWCQASGERLIRVIARHFFSSEASLAAFPVVIRNLERLAHATGWPVDLWATYLPDFRPPRTRPSDIDIHVSKSGKDEGGGTKLWNGFFSRKKGTVLLVDGDMQAFYAKEIMILRSLLQEMHEQRKAFGCAARTQIRMHRNTALNDLRIAQEVFYLSFGKPALPQNPLQLNLHKLPATYRKLGDVFSGCFAINLEHPATVRVRKEIANMRRKKMFFGFAFEYYLGMRFAQMNQVMSMYLPTRANHQVTQRSAHAVREMIRGDYLELRQSKIGKALENHVSSGRVLEQLRRLVSTRALHEACSLMSKTL